MNEPTAINPDNVDQLRRRIADLGPWFHNMNLGGIWTAPDHFLGDYPAVKFNRFAAALPQDLRGLSVLDIGCNGGFYSIEMKRRGALRVLGIDSDERYLAQARLAADVCNCEIEFRKHSAYDVGALGERFDVVLFMGVLYHLRHPLLALDLIHEHVAKDILVFQSVLRGAKRVYAVQPDYPFEEVAAFNQTGFPKLHFIEWEFAGDWTNWWIPNRAAAEAMLRSAGFAIEDRIEEEVYICRRRQRPYAERDPGAVYPARGAQP